MNSPLQSRLISPNLQWSGPGSGWAPFLLLSKRSLAKPSEPLLLVGHKIKSCIESTDEVQHSRQHLQHYFGLILVLQDGYAQRYWEQRLQPTHIIYITLLRYIRVFWETPVRHLSNTLNVASHLRVLLVLFGLRHLLRLSDLFSDSLLRYLGKISAKASDWELSGIGQQSPQFEKERGARDFLVGQAKLSIQAKRTSVSHVLLFTAQDASGQQLQRQT